jgi:membrane protease YdiL (CAAX protease family)
MSRAVGFRASGRSLASEMGESPPGYFEQSQVPLTCLLFLTPLLCLHEIGSRWMAADPERLLAFHHVKLFLHVFGASGRYLPAFAVATILLSSHIARKGDWTLDISTAGFMILESIALSLPLFALDALSSHYIPLAAAPVHGHSRWPSLFIMCVGAGIYEELIFRLVFFTLLNILLIDLLRLPKKRVILAIVVAGAVLFSLYHYWWGEAFAWRSFAFRTAAGIYFGLIFISRGFGVTAGTHAAYDLLAVSMWVVAVR